MRKQQPQAYTQMRPPDRLALAVAFGIYLAAFPLFSAQAQQPVQTWPSPGSASGAAASSTITATGVFQKVFDSTNTSVGGLSTPMRHDCTIQNNGSNVMYISEGTTAALATTAKSQQLFPSGQYHCAGPNAVETGEIDITGTAGDAFYAAQQ